MGRGRFFVFREHCNKSLTAHVLSNQALDVLGCIVLLLEPFIYTLVILVRVKAYDKLFHRPFAVEDVARLCASVAISPRFSLALRQMERDKRDDKSYNACFHRCTPDVR